VSALFLQVPYGADTLIGSAFVPEQLVVELTRVDCFTYADYVEALKRSSNRTEFLTQLAQVRYRGGDVAFTQRRHFFTDWAADKPANATDVTASLGDPQNGSPKCSTRRIPAEITSPGFRCSRARSSIYRAPASPTP